MERESEKFKEAKKKLRSGKIRTQKIKNCRKGQKCFVFVTKLSRFLFGIYNKKSAHLKRAKKRMLLRKEPKIAKKSRFYKCGKCKINSKCKKNS